MTIFIMMRFTLRQVIQKDLRHNLVKLPLNVVENRKYFSTKWLKPYEDCKKINLKITKHFVTI